MQLSVSERLVLLSVLPERGDFTTIRIVHELKSGLSFTETEHAALNFQSTDDGMTVWDSKGDVSETISFGPRAFTMLADALEQLSNDKKLTEEHLSVYEKFLDADDTLEVIQSQTAGPTVIHAEAAGEG